MKLNILKLGFFGVFLFFLLIVPIFFKANAYAPCETSYRGFCYRAVQCVNQGFGWTAGLGCPVGYVCCDAAAPTPTPYPPATPCETVYRGYCTSVANCGIGGGTGISGLGCTGASHTFCCNPIPTRTPTPTPRPPANPCETVYNGFCYTAVNCSNAGLHSVPGLGCSAVCCDPIPTVTCQGPNSTYHGQCIALGYAQKGGCSSYLIMPTPPFGGDCQAYYPYGSGASTQAACCTGTVRPIGNCASAGASCRYSNWPNFASCSKVISYNVQQQQSVAGGGNGCGVSSQPDTGSTNMCGLQSYPDSSYPNCGSATAVCCADSAGGGGGGGGGPTPTPAPTYTISGVVFLDLNRNATKDAGENAWTTSSIQIQTTWPAGGPTYAQSSTSNGQYSITGQADTYTLSLPATLNGSPNIPTGYVAITNTTNEILPPNQTLDFGIMTSPVSISGTVFIDYDGDGVKDAEDTGYPNALTINATASGGNATGTANTSSGAYTISNLNQNTSYTITLASAIPTGYILTTTNPINVNTTTSNLTNQNFGISPTFSISGNVYNDVNKNTCWNPSVDLPLYTQADTSVVIKSGTTGNVVKTVPVDNTGHYTAGGLIPDTNGYIVTYAQNSFYEITTPNSYSVKVGTPGKSIQCDVSAAQRAACN